MLDRWNAHDIEGYMEVYWKSPELLVVVDSEQFNGWQQLHDSYLNGYPDRNAMGFIQPKRIQVKLLKPDLALALTWWSVTFPSSKQSVLRSPSAFRDPIRRTSCDSSMMGRSLTASREKSGSAIGAAERGGEGGVGKCSRHRRGDGVDFRVAILGCHLNGKGNQL